MPSFAGRVYAQEAGPFGLEPGGLLELALVGVIVALLLCVAVQAGVFDVFLMNHERDGRK